jgi:hypothetical protein
MMVSITQPRFPVAVVCLPLRPRLVTAVRRDEPFPAVKNLRKLCNESGRESFLEGHSPGTERGLGSRGRDHVVLPCRSYPEGSR